MKMNNRSPLVSVLMSTFNSEKTLERAIDSILNQSYKNIEFLICNDGSTDNTKQILDKYSNLYAQIEIINNVNNVGLTKSLNLLINKSNGDFIARQDADDYSDPARIKEQLKHCNDNKFQAVFTRSYNLNKNSSMQNISYLIPYKLLVKFRNPFVHGTMLINSKIIKTFGGYDEDFYFAQDYKLYRDLIDNRIRIKKERKILYYLNTKNNISSLRKKEQKYYANCVKNRKIPKRVLKGD
jgi:glycosyltransferase involved in cell wall biosynthesis